MKVKELIELLKELDQEKEIEMDDWNVGTNKIVRIDDFEGKYVLT